MSPMVTNLPGVVKPFALLAAGGRHSRERRLRPPLVRLLPLLVITAIDRAYVDLYSE